MRNDWYLRAVLTIIAAALVYLCAVFTPATVAFAQGARTPGESTGPAEMVIVGWKLPPDAAFPVQLSGRVADVRVTNEELRIAGRVLTEQAPRTSTRVVLAGWEDRGSVPTA